MTQSEKLQALLQKAIENKWRPKHGSQLEPFIGIHEWHLTDDNIYFTVNNYIGINQLIFNHDFAKALINFPLREKGEWYGNTYYDADWEPLLRGAVINEDPINYLYKAVFPNGE